MTSVEPIGIEAPRSAAGERLDAFLSRHLEVPRNRIQGWIREGHVAIAGRAVKPSLKLSGGERIECTPQPVLAGESVEAEPGELRILHEDEQIVVIDKPARMAMHPGAGRAAGTLANRLLAAYPEMAAVGGTGRPGIIHRLDIDTTGVVAVARTERAYQELSADFAARRISKTYLAVCYGIPEPRVGEIDKPIGRHAKHRKEMTVRADGRPARTTYAALGTSQGVGLLKVGLETGRTHQIRVHLKAIGHPLVGDPVYGEARWKSLPGAVRTRLRDFERPALHAWILELRHPTSGRRLVCTAPPPADLCQLWEALGGGDLGVAVLAS